MLGRIWRRFGRHLALSASDPEPRSKTARPGARLAEPDQLAVLERRQEHRGLAGQRSIELSGRKARQAIALAKELALEVRLLETLGHPRVDRVGGIADVGQLHLEGGRGVGAEREP